MIGVIFNAATVLVGGLVGLALKDRLPERVSAGVIQGLGLFTLYLGIRMALASENPLILVMSISLGIVIGEGFQLQQRLDRLLAGKTEEIGGTQKPGQLMVTGFAMFCIGAMSIVGSFEEGLSGKREIVMTKSLMDLFSSMALTAAFGRGILLAIIPLFLYQGSLTLSAGYLAPLIAGSPQTELAATGGLLMIGLGLNMLSLTSLRLINLLPSLGVAPILALLAPKLISLLPF
jgi:uncharacterized membrane protein YqgA involved in biofilm formation